MVFFLCCLMVVYKSKFKECVIDEMVAGMVKNGRVCEHALLAQTWSRTAHRRLQQDGLA
jgi:hypothetical protein